MTTNAMIGIGIIFQVNTGASPDTWQTLAEVFELSPPNAQVDDIDATHYASPDRTREFISGLTDLGEMTVNMNYIPGSESDNYILAWRQSGANRLCRIVYPTSPNLQDTFQAYPKGYEPALPLDDKLTANLTLKVAGAVTRAAYA